jgi:hypothetical protein
MASFSAFRLDCESDQPNGAAISGCGSRSTTITRRGIALSKAPHISGGGPDTSPANWQKAGSLTRSRARSNSAAGLDKFRGPYRKLSRKQFRVQFSESH